MQEHRYQLKTAWERTEPVCDRPRRFFRQISRSRGWSRALFLCARHPNFRRRIRYSRPIQSTSAPYKHPVSRHVSKVSALEDYIRSPIHRRISSCLIFTSFLFVASSPHILPSTTNKEAGGNRQAISLVNHIHIPSSYISISSAQRKAAVRHGTYPDTSGVGSASHLHARD